MLKVTLAAIGLVATSVPGLCQSTPAPVSSMGTQPVATVPPPPIVLPARHVRRAGSPGFSAGTPIVSGNTRIRIDHVGQVLTDELP